MSYFKKSINKFKDDFFAKGIYDIVKWVGIAFLFYLGTTLIPNDFSFINFLKTEYLIRLYYSIIYSIFIFILSFLLFKKLYDKRYKALQLDNFTDELTGLKNHKALNEYLTKTVEELKNNTKWSSLSVIVIDVDNFKTFNTTFGHAKSDQILRRLGQLLNNDKRATDETFRQFLRGDEFVVIAKDTNMGDAIKAAERKRKMIENNAFNIDEIFYKLTVSCGVTEFKIEKDTIDSFLNRASMALSSAKGVKNKNNTKSVY